MNRAGSPLRELLYFLLRVVLFALTGEWPKEEQARPASRRAEPPPTFRAGPDRAGLLRTLEVARAQRPAHALARLSQLERLGRELRAPFEAHARAQGVGLRRRQVVVLTDCDPRLVRELAAHTPTWLVSLPQEELGSLRSETRTARSIAHSWVGDVPGWLGQLRRAHQVPKGMLLPPRVAGYGAEEVAGLFGPWLPAILSEVITTSLLGPGYTWDQLREVQALGHFRAAQASPAPGDPLFLSEEPPQLVRFVTSLRTLEALGFERDAAGAQRAFAGALGGAPALSLPLLGGGHEELAWDVWSEELELLLGELLFSPQPALHGSRLLEVPTLRYGAAEHARTQELAAALARGEQVRASARFLLSGSLLVLSNGGVSEAQLLRTLEGGVADKLPSGATRATAGAVSATPASKPRTSWAGAFRNPQILREAVVLGAALAPRRGVGPRRRA